MYLLFGACFLLDQINVLSVCVYVGVLMFVWSGCLSVCVRRCVNGCMRCVLLYPYLVAQSVFYPLLISGPVRFASLLCRLYI